jgi:uncharacterized protein YkwD
MSLARRPAGPALILCAIAALALAGCAPRPTAGRAPSPLYASLAQPGAALDPQLAASLINDYRRGLGLAPVGLDPALMRAAAARLAGVAGASSLALPGEKDVLKRLTGAGIAATSARENVSAGYYSMSDAFSGWRGSPPNDATLRLAGARRMGLATRYVPGSKYAVYWVLIMAGP